MSLLPTPHLDGKHVVFGKLLAGRSIVRQIEDTPTDGGDKPQEKIIIANCGELSPEEVIDSSKKADAAGDAYEDHPSDEEEDVHKPEISLKIASDLRSIGTNAFKKGDYAVASKKCTHLSLFLRLSRSVLKHPKTSDQKALKYLLVNPVLPEGNRELEVQTINLKLSLYLNSAQACLKQNTVPSARQAVEMADKALSLDSAHSTKLPGDMHKDLSADEKAKAYFRRGSAHSILKEHSEAAKDFTQASALQPSDQGIKAALAQAKKAGEAQKAQEKARMAKMFA